MTEPVAVYMPAPEEAECVSRWRSRAYLAHAADVASTIAAIETGRGQEGNPLVRAVFGKRPAPHEVILGKLAILAPVEIWHNARLRRGDYAGVCRSYRITAFVIGGVAMLNFRVHF